MIELNV